MTENNMEELTLNGMENISGGAQAAGLTDVPLAMIKMKAQQFKQAGKTFDETVIAVIKYFGLPSEKHGEVRSYIASIWASI